MFQWCILIEKSHVLQVWLECGAVWQSLHLSFTLSDSKHLGLSSTGLVRWLEMKGRGPAAATAQVLFVCGRRRPFLPSVLLAQKKVTIPLPSPQYIWLKYLGNPFYPLSALWPVQLLPTELMGQSAVKPDPGRVNHPLSAFYLLEHFLLLGIKFF